MTKGSINRVLPTAFSLIILSEAIILSSPSAAAQQGNTPAPGQGGTQGATSNGTGAGVQVGAPTQSRGTGAINGGQTIPGAAVVTDGPAECSLEEAIQIAIRNNLTTLLARERRREAEGFKQEARSA